MAATSVDAKGAIPAICAKNQIKNTRNRNRSSTTNQNTAIREATRAHDRAVSAIEENTPDIEDPRDRHLIAGAIAEEGTERNIITGITGTDPTAGGTGEAQIDIVINSLNNSLNSFNKRQLILNK